MIDTDVAAVVAKLSDEARKDVREGNCIMGSDICVCGSSEKERLNELQLLTPGYDLDAGYLLTPLGIQCRDYLMRGGAISPSPTEKD